MARQAARGGGPAAWPSSWAASLDISILEVGGIRVWVWGLGVVGQCEKGQLKRLRQNIDRTG